MRKVEQVEFSSGSHLMPVHITLLTQERCGFCEQAQATLERLTREYPLALTYIDLASAEGRRLALEHGVLFAPGVLLDGAFFSYGRLSERKLRRALAKLSQPPQSDR